MPIGFGFSVGDFISGISLVKDLIDALRDTAGGRADYLELMCELYSLERSLTAVRYISFDEDQRLAYQAVVEAVGNCRQCIDTFLKRVSSYHQLGASTFGLTPVKTWKQN